MPDAAVRQPPIQLKRMHTRDSEDCVYAITLEKFNQRFTTREFPRHSDVNPF